MATVIELVAVTILTVFILLLTTFYLYFKYLYTYWSRKNVVSLLPQFPFGSVKTMFLGQRSFGDCFAELYKDMKLKTRFAGGVYFFSKPLLLLIDPELIKTTLTKEFTSFHDRDHHVNEEKDPLSSHLVFLTGTRWRNLRAKLTPTFTSGKMKTMFQTISDCTNDLEELIKWHMDMHESIDIRDVFTRLTTDTIMSCAFGIESNSIKEPDNKFNKYGRMIFQLGFRDKVAHALAIYPWITKFISVPVTNSEVSKFFLNVVRSVVEYREKNSVHRKDFLELLLRLKNNQSVLDDELDKATSSTQPGITFNELAAQAFIFFAAGFETTSSTLSFGLFELAGNPEIQRQLRKEVRDVLSKHGGVICYDAVMSMKYMDKVIQEVLRKYPAVPILNRNCTKEYHIDEMGYTVKKGTGIVISVLGLHRDPEHYPDPDKFDPERFSDEEKAKRHPYAYLPFGEGPRMCIGMRFALLQVKLVMAVLLNKFEFTVDPKTVTPIYFRGNTAFLEPEHTIWLQAHASNNHLIKNASTCS